MLFHRASYSFVRQALHWINKYQLNVGYKYSMHCRKNLQANRGLQVVYTRFFYTLQGTGLKLVGQVLNKLRKEIV